MQQLIKLLPKEKRPGFEKSFEERPYQVEIVEKALQGLQNHTNPAVVLASGLGKTYTSLALAILFRKKYPDAKGRILIIVPSRLSLIVYKEHIAWADDFAKIITTDQESSSQLQGFDEQWTEMDILISNPRKLSSLVYRNAIPFNKLEDFGLVIFDGYHEIIDPFRNGDRPVDNHLDTLLAVLSILKRPMTFFCTHKRDDLFWDPILQPQKLEVQPDLAQGFVPHVIVKLMGIYDADIARRDRVLSRHLATNFNTIKQYVALHSKNQHTVRIRQIVTQMRAIANGDKDKFFLYYRKLSPLILPVDVPLRHAFERLVKIIDMRLLLFEDLLLDEDPAETLIEFNQLITAKGRPRTYGSRINMKGKILMVKEVVAEKGQKRGLIFCRNLEVCERLAGTFVTMGRNVSLIHRDIPEDEQHVRIKNFKRFKGSLLLMTRYMSARGFDIPEAEYAIFYSPKDKEQVMWEEISKVRSTWKDPKEIYLLYYKETGEEAKLNRLVWSMKVRDNYQFTPVDEHPTKKG